MDGPDSGRSFESEWTVMGRSGWSNKFNMINTFDKNGPYPIKKIIIYDNRSKWTVLKEIRRSFASVDGLPRINIEDPMS